jgi:inosose dehydratase
MSYKVAGAPGAWGIENTTNPNNPSWERVLDEIASSGYKGLELGPYGYLPQDTEVLLAELDKRNLQIVAGTIYDNLVSETNFEAVLQKTHKTCAILSKLPKAEMIQGQRFTPPYLVVIDEVNEVRSPLAGHKTEAIRLNEEDRERLINHIKIIADIATSYGIRPVLHPHAGGYIEFEDEIDGMMTALPSEIGLCLDTGHLYYSGMNPTLWLEKYKERLDYVHFKDIHKETYEKVMKENIGFFEGCSIGVMCPIGKGVVDYKEVKATLDRIGYKGWITIEQERDPKDCDGSMKDAIESLKYLSQQGYES